MSLYHYLIGFPKEFTAPQGIRNLSYTNHALREAQLDGINNLPKFIDLSRGTLIELNLKNEFPRYVYRIGYSAMQDIVLVLQSGKYSQLKVITCWTNSVKDRHSTLNKSKYTKP